MLIAFNKMDRPAAVEAWPAFRRARDKDGLAVEAISAMEGEGLDRPAAAPGRDAPRRGRPGRAARAVRRRRPPDLRDGRRLPGGAGGGRDLPRPRCADRADRGPDQLRRRGIGGTLPAQPGQDGHRYGAAAGRDRGRATSSGSVRPNWNGVAIRGRSGDRGARGERRSAASARPSAHWACSAGPSIPSTSPTWPSPRRPGRRWAWSASSSCRPASRRTSAR